MQNNSKIYQEMCSTQAEAHLIAEKLKEGRKFYAYAKGKLLQVECREIQCSREELAQYVQNAFNELRNEGEL